jgi:23S rRNA (uracil1939-C5)-methyltransferase
MKTGESIRLQMEKISSDGSAIARTPEGLVVFVPGALPGEDLEVRLSVRKKEYAIGSPGKIYMANPGRTEPFCPYYGTCGGCQLQHADYNLQRELKWSIVNDAFARIYKNPYPEISPCSGSPLEKNYRNKTSFPVGGRSGAAIVGYYSRRSHDIVETVRCPIMAKDVEESPELFAYALRSSGLAPYNEKTGKGMIRHIILRYAFSTKDILVSIVTAKKASKEEKKLILEKILPPLKEKYENLRTLTLNYNPSRGNIIVGKNTETLSGDGKIEEDLGPFRFRYDTTAFFQVNPLQAVRLYEKAAEMAATEENDPVLELYSGIGTLTAFLSRHSSSVTAVEEWGPSVERMRENMERNRLSGKVRIAAGPVENHIRSFPKGFRTIVVDPPRTGCSREVLAGMMNLEPEKIVYVSCNPATLARDAGLLLEGGYEPVEICCFDMFPQTVHVESIALFRRKNT